MNECLKDPSKFVHIYYRQKLKHTHLHKHTKIKIIDKTSADQGMCNLEGRQEGRISPHPRSTHACNTQSIGCSNVHEAKYEYDHI